LLLRQEPAQYVADAHGLGDSGKTNTLQEKDWPTRLGLRLHNPSVRGNLGSGFSGSVSLLNLDWLTLLMTSLHRRKGHHDHCRGMLDVGRSGQFEKAFCQYIFPEHGQVSLDWLDGFSPVRG
jgi:hypothetical protein